MRRRIVTITVFLLLLSGGAIVNVAVAWGCATLEIERGLTTRLASQHVYQGESLRFHATTGFLYSAGWPCRSMLWTSPLLSFSLSVEEFSQQDLAQPLLPMIPAWRGFATNTAFYSVILLLPFTPRLFRTARSSMRRRRGLCERCAYPIGVRSVCTECGAAVVRSTQT